MTNVCEHGDHPAPEGKRFCSRECADCERGTRVCRWCKWEANPPDLGIALSVHAPWAWAMMQPAPYGKDVENRSARFPLNRGGKPILGRVWVHASLWPKPGPLSEFSYKRFDFVGECEKAVETLWESQGWLDETYDVRDTKRIELLKSMTREKLGIEIPKISELDNLRGHIVGSVEVYGYATPESPPDSVWYIQGSLGILVRDPWPLVTPVRAKGALGWWGVPDDVLAEVRRVA